MSSGATTAGEAETDAEGMVLGSGFLGLFWDLRIVWGGGNPEKGLRRVGGAILVLLDHTVELVLGLLSSSDADGGGRSPYNPPSIFSYSCFFLPVPDRIEDFGF